MRSSSGCGTDDCGPTSAMSRPSTMLSPPSTRPSGAPGRRSSAFVHKDPRPPATPSQGRRMALDARKPLSPWRPPRGLNPADLNANWQNFEEYRVRQLSLYLQVFSAETRLARYRFTRERSLVRNHPCP